MVYGRSRTAPVHARYLEGSIVHVRLHRVFATAPTGIITALGRWLRAGRRARRACATLDAWIAEQIADLPRPDPGPLRPHGVVHDLDALTSAVVANDLHEFAGALPGVTWGRRTRSSSVRCLHLGTFHPETNLVRIHPVLDHRDVPEFFVRFVLFHELLHAATPAQTTATGRCQHHSPEFRQRERAHPDFQRALHWEEQHLTRLIARARQGYGAC